MPRKSKASQKRSAASHKGWITRRRNERAEERKRKERSRKRREKKREVTPGAKGIMWRLTILHNYSIRGKRSRSRKRKSESPMASAFRLTAWFKTKAELTKKRASLVLRAEREFRAMLRKDRKLFTRDDTPSIAVEDVPYLKGYIGTVVVVNEIDESDEPEEE